jgi:hypothetical protein
VKGTEQAEYPLPHSGGKERNTNAKSNRKKYPQIISTVYDFVSLCQLLEIGG